MCADTFTPCDTPTQVPWLSDEAVLSARTLLLLGFTPDNRKASHTGGGGGEELLLEGAAGALDSETEASSSRKRQQQGAAAEAQKQPETVLAPLADANCGGSSEGGSEVHSEKHDVGTGCEKGGGVRSADGEGGGQGGEGGGAECQTEIRMIAVDGSGVEHTLRKWSMFRGQKGAGDVQYKGGGGEWALQGEESKEEGAQKLLM